MKNQIAFIFLVCFFSHSVLACKCLLQSTGDIVKDVTDSYKDSYAVVNAIARAVEDTQVPFEFAPGKTSQVKSELTTFEVTKSWKGIKTQNIRTRITTGCCVCAISFEIDKEYLLYLYNRPDSDGYYTTSNCSRTRPIEKATEDEKILDKLTKNKLRH